MNRPFSGDRSMLWGVGLVLVMLVAWGVYSTMIRQRTAAPKPIDVAKVPLRQPVVVAGVSRPESYLRTRHNGAGARRGTGQGEPDKGSSDAQPSVQLGEHGIYGGQYAIDPKLNQAARLAFESVEQEKSPQRQTPHFISTTRFDRAAFIKDPTAYLEDHVPGRVFESAQPGEGVEVIRPVGKTFHQLRSGESIRLQARVEPGMPVTFSSFDAGTFENSLSTISVQASDEGIASANYTAVRSGGGIFNVLAASPVAAEQLHFRISVNHSSIRDNSSTRSGDQP